MPKFKIYTDEKITVWQRVGLIVEAESEAEAQKMLNDPARFGEMMFNGGGEYNGEIDPYWDTSDFVEWDHSSAEITELGGNC